MLDRDLGSRRSRRRYHRILDRVPPARHPASMPRPATARLFDGRLGVVHSSPHCSHPLFRPVPPQAMPRQRRHMTRDGYTERPASGRAAPTRHLSHTRADAGSHHPSKSRRTDPHVPSLRPWRPLPPSVSGRTRSRGPVPQTRLPRTAVRPARHQYLDAFAAHRVVALRVASNACDACRGAAAGRDRG